MSLQIFVDADACPVILEIERIAKKYHVPLHLYHLYCDTNHCCDVTCQICGANTSTPCASTRLR